MTNTYWSEFSILFIAALLGGVAIIPYSLRLLKASSQGKPLKMPLPKLMVLSFLQTAVLSAIAIGIGLLASHAIGLGISYQPFVRMLWVAIVLGLLGGLALLFMDILFLPYLPEALIDTAKKTTQWENFAASFYGGINEELLMRLFGFSVITWLLSRVWHTSMGLPTDGIFWIANIVLAVIFAIGHLPALKGVVGKITPVLLARTFLLNMPIALICGWLFWHYGIEAAIVAHFSADIVYHMGGTAVLRFKNKN